MKKWHKLAGTLLVVLATLLAVAAPQGHDSLAVGSTIYVDADATSGANNGTSWDDAFTTLQPALAAAVVGDQIWVAEGIYLPSEEFTPGDPRSAAFQMKNGVAIYGGFDPSVGATGMEQRDWVSHVTILSGDLNGDDGPDFANNDENSYHVFYHPDGTALDSSAILDGLTISGGNFPSGAGAGMLNEGSSPTVSNCSFVGNSAPYGAGMNNRFSSVTLTNCTFAYNDGDAVYEGGSTSALTNCTFAHNSGLGMFNDGSDPTLTNCTFEGNFRGMGNNDSSPTLINCHFISNSTFWDGAGMYNYDSSPELTNCTFSGNSAGYGGGMANFDGSAPILTNCTFIGNSADAGVGGGMYNVSSWPTLINCTFTGNVAEGEFGWAGGMANSFSTPTLTNCILWGDSPDEIGYDMIAPPVTYSDIQGGFPGEGNIDADPLFVNPAGGDYHLAPGSPCIDTGNNAAEDLPAYDFEGDARIVDGNGDGTATVDMGVDEWAGYETYLPFVVR